LEQQVKSFYGKHLSQQRWRGFFLQRIQWVVVATHLILERNWKNEAPRHEQDLLESSATSEIVRTNNTGSLGMSILHFGSARSLLWHLVAMAIIGAPYLAITEAKQSYDGDVDDTMTMTMTTTLSSSS
jgi:hypothetical protein